jgi:hypothetical protein
MAWTVSSGFQSQLDAQVPDAIIRKFTFSTSDSTDKVLDFGSISRRGDKVIAGDMSIRLSNADQFWNNVQADKTHFLRSATMDIGFTINNSNETLRVFTGDLTKIRNASRAKVNVSFRDKMNTLTKRSVGNASSAVAFTGSDWNPADMFFTIATSWGRLSGIQSTSNPDIDWDTFSTWKTNLTLSGFAIQGNFEGDQVPNIFQKIAEITNSVIIAEGDGKIYTYKFQPSLATNVVSYDGTNILKEIERQMDIKTLVNDVKVFHGYNPDSDTWTGFASKVFTSSVNTFGTYEESVDGTLVWHATANSALRFLERRYTLSKEPLESIRFKSSLKGMVNQIGDSITVTDSLLAYSQDPFKITDLDINLNKGIVSIDAIEDYDAKNWFFLDHATLGLLDKTNNPLF